MSPSVQNWQAERTALQSRALRPVWTLWQTTIMKLERMQRISNICRTTIGEELKEGPRKLVLRSLFLSLSPRIYVVEADMPESNVHADTCSIQHRA